VGCVGDANEADVEGPDRRPERALIGSEASGVGPSDGDRAQGEWTCAKIPDRDSLGDGGADVDAVSELEPEVKRGPVGSNLRTQARGGERAGPGRGAGTRIRTGVVPDIRSCVGGPLSCLAPRRAKQESQCDAPRNWSHADPPSYWMRRSAAKRCTSSSVRE